jgi:hypothetical protein
LASAQALVLTAGDMNPGLPGVFTVNGGGAALSPGTPVWFMKGDSEGPGTCPGYLEGGCWDILSPRFVNVTNADAGGIATWAYPIPADADVGSGASFQAAVDVGAVRLSNALSVTLTCEFDTDGDGVCNPDDVCIGDDATGDSDDDGVCNDLDVCDGFDDAIDTDGDGIPDGCDVGALCSEVATAYCVGKGWTVVGAALGGNIVCTIDGRSTGSNCDTCSTYNIVVWTDGSQERHCPGFYSTVAGEVYSAHTPCTCGDNLDFCDSWDMAGCTPD